MNDDLRKILNPEQYAAATAGDGPILVLAAAGTGKTQTLVYRVAYLVDKGVEPQSILLLTFTNKAANEMLERAKATVGPSVGDIWSGTFHHVCNRILRHHAPLLGYRSNFVIADRDDSRRLIEKAMKEIGVGGDSFPKRDVLASLFGNAANRDVPLEQVLEEKLSSAPFDLDAIVAVRDVYTRMKFDDGIMDFDDLLVNAVRLFELKPEVLAFYRRQFDHILVDEYQDTNAIQSRFVDMLAGQDGNIMAVGDDFQCIYTWRGADFRNIMGFPQRYPGARVIKLERNYRSTPEILDVANACIAGNTEQFQKTLRATHAHGEKPTVFRVYDGTAQSMTVAELIHRLVDRGFAHSDIAVLYRSHFHSIDLQMILTRARVPFTITSGLGVFESAHVKDLLALLRVMCDPQDRLAFERFVVLLPGIGEQTATKAWKKLGGRCDLSTREGRAALLAALRPAARAAMEPLAAAVADYFATRAESGKEPVAAFVNDFLDRFYTTHLQEEYENPEERGDDILEVARQIEERGSLAAFLQDVALLTNVDAEAIGDQRYGRDTVRLSTIHQAKGLEWPVVIVLWACEDMFPSSRAIRESGDDSEERRLFYVAVTRARKLLCLFAPGGRKDYNGSNIPCRPSRFITEIPQQLLNLRYGAL